jgi:hypothetical protein
MKITKKLREAYENKILENDDNYFLLNDGLFTPT